MDAPVSGDPEPGSKYNVVERDGKRYAEIPVRQPNREQRRRKVKNRGFTKKGNTRVIFVDDSGKPHNIPTKIGSRIDKEAKKNAKRMRKKRKEARRAGRK